MNEAQADYGFPRRAGIGEIWFIVGCLDVPQDPKTAHSFCHTCLCPMQIEVASVRWGWHGNATSAAVTCGQDKSDTRPWAWFFEETPEICPQCRPALAQWLFVASVELIYYLQSVGVKREPFKVPKGFSLLKANCSFWLIPTIIPSLAPLFWGKGNIFEMGNQKIPLCLWAITCLCERNQGKESLGMFKKFTYTQRQKKKRKKETEIKQTPKN